MCKVAKLTSEPLERTRPGRTCPRGQELQIEFDAEACYAGIGYGLHSEGFIVHYMFDIRVAGRSTATLV